jgi:hypothetical protein
MTEHCVTDGATCPAFCEGFTHRQRAQLLQHLATHLKAAAVILPPLMQVALAREHFHISFCFIQLPIVNEQLILEYLILLVYSMMLSTEYTGVYQKKCQAPVASK